MYTQTQPLCSLQTAIICEERAHAASFCVMEAQLSPLGRSAVYSFYSSLPDVGILVFRAEVRVVLRIHAPHALRGPLTCATSFFVSSGGSSCRQKSRQGTTDGCRARLLERQGGCGCKGNDIVIRCCCSAPSHPPQDAESDR